MKDFHHKLVRFLMLLLFIAVVVTIVLLQRNSESIRKELKEPYVEKIKPIGEERNNAIFNASQENEVDEKTNLSIRDVISNHVTNDIEINDQNVSIVQNLRMVPKDKFKKSWGKVVLKTDKSIYYEPTNFDSRDLFKIRNNELLILIDKSNNEIRYLNNRLYVQLVDFKDMTEISKNFGLEIVSTNEKLNHVIYRPLNTKEDFMQKYIMMLEDERVDNIELGLSDGVMTTK